MSATNMSTAINPFGHPDRHYSTENSRQSNRKLSDAERRLEKLLNQIDPKLEERVTRSFRQWNNVLRDYLRTETALRLTVGDDSQAVPVRVVPGLPVPLLDIVGDFDESRLLLLLRIPLLETTSAGLVFIEALQIAQDDSVSSASRFVNNLINDLRKMDLKKKLSEIKEDVLGAYFFRVPEIQLYWMAIGLVCAHLQVEPEALTLVVVLHELAHAYSHLGRDIDAHRWEVDQFAQADINIVEGIAQFYTGAICHKMRDRYPDALRAYDALLELQSGPYLVHNDWVKIPGKQAVSSRAGEVVRAALVECRTQNLTGYSEFVKTLTLNHNRLGPSDRPDEARLTAG